MIVNTDEEASTPDSDDGWTNQDYGQLLFVAIEISQLE